MAGEPLHNPRAIRPRRSRRWIRWVAWGSLACLLLLGAGVFILTRPGVYTSLVASGLSNRLGADVQIREGSWEGGTTFKFSGITVRAIDLDGVPGEIANIETLVLTLNPGGILGNEAIVQDVAVGPGVLRVAEHVVDGSDINIARLFRNRGDPSRGGGRVQDEALPALPRSIIMNSILLETGRYSGDAFFLKGRMSLSGSVRPDPENMHEYQLELQGSSDQTGIVAVSGTFDPNTPRLKATMSEGELSAAILDFLPSMLSKKAEEMDLEGLISNVKIDWEGGLVPRVQVDLRDVSLTLSDSLDLPDFWARYSNEQYQKSPDPPRMHVNTGSILLEGTTLEFENLQGTFTSVSDEKLAEIPFMLDMSLKDLPIEPMLEGEGFEQVSSSFPFTLELQTDDFTLGEGVDTADIPLIVAQILAMFKVQTCTVSTRIRAERDAPANGIAGTLMYEGALAIRRASGAYVGFPYPLAELDADVEFNESTVFVRSLDARGAGDSRIRIHGEVEPRVDGSEVDINLKATNLPLDMTLVEAMPDLSAGALNSLFRNYGVETRAIAPHGDGGQSSHEYVDLDLDILRDQGPDMPTRLQGYITFDSLDLSWDSFPYPVTLGAGRLRWFGDELHLEGGGIGEGVEFRTISGGVGEVAGTILVPVENDRPASGLLNLAFRQQPVTPGFIEALRVPAPTAAELIDALRLEGMLEVRGPIDVNPSGDATWDLEIGMEGGSVEPSDQLARILGMGEAFWERDLRLDGLGVSLRCTQNMVDVHEISGVDGDMKIDMEGRIGLEDVLATDMQVDVSSAPIQDRLLRLAPDTLRQTMSGLWDRWSPAGHVDLKASILGESGEILTDVLIRKMSLDLQLEGDSERLAMDEGMIRIDGDSIMLDDVVINAFEGASDDGVYVIKGDVSWNESGTTTRMECSLEEGRFESPLLESMLKEFIAGDVATTWAEVEPTGRFDARAVLKLDPGDEWDWSLSVDPDDIAANYRGQRLESSFRHGEIGIENAFMRLENLGGECEAGSYVVSGSLGLTEGVQGQLVFDFDGRIDSREIGAIMPDVATEIMNSIKFDDGAGTSIRGGRIDLDLQPSVEYVSVDLELPLVLDGASLEAGTTFKDVAGSADITLKAVTGEPVQFSLDSHLDGVVIHGVALEEAALSMLLENGERLRLGSLSGDYAGGELHARAAFDLGHARSWNLELQVADASLVEFMPATDEAAGEEGVEESPTGSLYASAYMHGSLDDPDDTLGHGQVRIYDGDLRTLPVTVGIYQLLQFNPVIVVDSPNYLDVSWHMHGDLISLDEIALESAYEDYVTFSLVGSGSYDWDTQSIDAQLRPRTGTPLLGDVLGALQDRFYAIGVEGPLRNPEVQVIPFPDIQ